MRLLKTILIILLALVTLAYGATGIYDYIHPRNDAPVISCDSLTLELSVKDDRQVLLAGVTASDAKDGDLTAAIRISGISKFIDNSTVNVNYVVFDNDRNVGSLTRTVRYTDYESPRFSLKAALNYKLSEDILLLDRLHATDCLDGDITDSIRTSGLKDSEDGEIFFIDVQAVNSMDDASALRLPVVIQNNNLPRAEIVLTDYLIYLEQGSGFSPRSYLAQVITPEGTGDNAAVQVNNSVNTHSPGTYYVYYSYTAPDEKTISHTVLTVVVE